MEVDVARKRYDDVKSNTEKDLDENKKKAENFYQDMKSEFELYHFKNVDSGTYYELYKDKKSCPCTHQPPSPLPESKKIEFFAPI